MPSAVPLMNDPDESKLSDCQWLAFDAVGTLIDPDPTVAVAYQAVGARLGSRFTIAEVSQRFRSAFRRSERDGFPGGPLPVECWKTSDAVEAARWRWIVGEVLCDVQDQETCFRELWEHFSHPSSWKLFADVEQSLTWLVRSGYRLAIASNFDTRLHSVCDALPCFSQVERRIVSATVGCRKPSGDFFAAVVRECACEPGQILMIGDNHEYDVVAPRLAGLRSLHLDRSLAVANRDQLTSLIDLSVRLRS